LIVRAVACHDALGRSLRHGFRTVLTHALRKCDLLSALLTHTAAELGERQAQSAEERVGSEALRL